MRRASLGLVLALILVHVSCAGTTKSTGGTTPPPSQIAVSVAPTAANVRVGAGQPFTATVTGTTNQSVTWSVNGVAGGNATVGLISNAGVYTAPAALPNPNTITISATSAADSSAKATSDVTLWNATPVLSSVSPATFTSGAYTLTLTGSKFVSGAQVLFGGAAITTHYVSATQLTATGSAPSAGIFAVSVSNPNPGSSNSGCDERDGDFAIRRQSSSTTECVQRDQPGPGRRAEWVPSLPGGQSVESEYRERAGGSEFCGHHQFHR